MWEQTLIESKGDRKDANRWWTIPVAAGLHAGVVITALLMSYWHVEALNAPHSRMVMYEPIRIQMAPPAKRGGGGATQQKKNIEKKPPVEFTQPAEIPSVTPESQISTEQLGPATDVVLDPNAPAGEGVPGGIDGGWGTNPLATGPGMSQEEPAQQIVAGVAPPVLIKRVEPQYPRLA